MSFENLGLNEKLLKAIAECGYTEPTPIQAQAIPAVLMMRDVVGLAQTGTGKTASFTLPMMEVLDGGRAKARMPRSLILTPTRELAAQISENFDTYGKYSNLSMALLVGGVSMDAQVKKLDRGVDVLIATPGRLMDLFERGRILLTDIKILVIDEADRMLDMGFIPDIEKIVGLLPFNRQTLLFSATMQPEIRKMTEKFLSNPKEISVTPPASTSTNVEQFIIKTHPKGKDELLAKLIEKEKVQSAFVFCNRKRDIDGLTRFLKAKGYKASGMHGDMPQSARSKTLEEFKAGNVTLLICSDVAGRGIDVSDLSHVFNYDVPFNADDYVHRIGRTGRAGKTGRAFMMVTNNDDKFLSAITKLIRKDIDVFSLDGEKAAQKPERKPAPRKTETSDDKPKASKPKASKPRPQAEKHKNPKPAQMDEAHSASAHKGKKKRDDDDDGGNGGGSKGFGDDVPSFF